MSSHVIGAELARLHRTHLANTAGALATYIPELGKADPAWFGISLCTVDGSVHQVGHTDQPFTVQSVSKPFVFALALQDNDIAAVLERVGMEPSGDAFNSIILDPTNRPHNPMVNAGAIVTVGLVAGSTPEDRFARILDVMSAFAGRSLTVDDQVFESERTSGHRNRAIAHLLKNAGALVDEVDDVLDVYFRQCSIEVTAGDLAVMAATLANGGINPLTGRRVVSAQTVADVLSVMFTSGMYNYSGEWAYRTGLPAKSGVSGGISALVPGQLGVGVFSPLVDDRGNSIRGVQVCEDLSRRLGFHLFHAVSEPASPVRSIVRGSDRRSMRVRSSQAAQVLRDQGRRILVVEAQGRWSFVACERFMRAIDEWDADHVIVDVSRIGPVDATATLLTTEYVRFAQASGVCIAFAGAVPDGLFECGAAVFADVDAALEEAENRLLARLGRGSEPAEPIDLAASDLGRDLDGPTLELVRAAGVEMSLATGEVLAKAGEVSDSMFLVTSGHLTATVEGRRVAAFGPGALIGEMGFVSGAPRSATITADMSSTLVAFGEMHGLAPEVRDHINRSIARVLASRLETTTRVLTRLAG